MSRNTRIEQARSWLAQSPLYLDTETTGLSSIDEVVEIAIIDDAGQTLINSLVKPIKAQISDGARAVHGITDKMIATAPTLADIWPLVRAVTANRLVLIYNAEYDTSILRRSLSVNEMDSRMPFAFDCAMLAYAEFYGDWNGYHQAYRWQRLENACRQCGIKAVQDHRALGDTLLTRMVVHTMAAAILTEKPEEEYPF